MSGASRFRPHEYLARAGKTKGTSVHRRKEPPQNARASLPDLSDFAVHSRLGRPQAGLSVRMTK